MFKEKKTKLSAKQKARLINHYDIDKVIFYAYLCKLEETQMERIEVIYMGGASEYFYPNGEDMDFIINGIQLTRKEN